MPRICAIAICENRQGTDKNISFHAFPKHRKLCSLWRQKCCRKDNYLDVKSALVCSEHFHPEDFHNDMKACLMPGRFKRRLKEDAVPSLKLPVMSTGCQHSGVTPKYSQDTRLQMSLPSANSMDPKERALLVKQALQEYEMRAKENDTNLRLHEHLVKVTPADVSSITDSFSDGQRLSERLARLQAKAEPAPLQRRYASPLRRWRGRPGPPSGADRSLVGPGELPEGLLSASGSLPQPAGRTSWRRAWARSPLNRGAAVGGRGATRHDAESKDHKPIGRRGRGRSRGRLLQMQRPLPAVGQCDSAAQSTQRSDQKSPGRRERARPPGRRAPGRPPVDRRAPGRSLLRPRSTRAAARRGDGALKEGSNSGLDDGGEEKTSLGTRMEGGRENGLGDARTMDTHIRTADHASYSRRPDSSEDEDSDSDDASPEFICAEPDILGNGDTYDDDRVDDDDSMVTVFPCVQVVQRNDESEGEADVHAQTTHMVLDAPLSNSSGSEMSPAPSPPPPPAPPPSRQVTRTILVRRPNDVGSSTRPAVLRLVPGSVKGAPVVATVGQRTIVVDATSPPPRPVAIVGQRTIVVDATSPPPPPPSPPAASAVEPPADSSDDSSESELESDDCDLDRPSNDAELTPDTDMPTEDLNKWSHEMLVLRKQLAKEEAELRLQEVHLSRDTEEDPQPGLDEVYPVPASPPPLPDSPDAYLIPGMVPRNDALPALRRLRRRFYPMCKRVLRSAVELRRAQARATAARLRARQERRCLRSRFSRLLTVTQWSALERGLPPVQWPGEDLERAGRLRTACGDAGYQFLQSQWGLPLPSLASLPQPSADPAVAAPQLPPSSPVQRACQPRRSAAQGTPPTAAAAAAQEEGEGGRGSSRWACVIVSDSKVS